MRNDLSAHAESRQGTSATAMPSIPIGTAALDRRIEQMFRDREQDADARA